MRVEYSGRFYEFRKCDTEGISQEKLQELTDKTGYMQYEPGVAWLVVKDIGYGWEVVNG